jgi:hypothetical protein
MKVIVFTRERQIYEADEDLGTINAELQAAAILAATVTVMQNTYDPVVMRLAQLPGVVNCLQPQQLDPTVTTGEADPIGIIPGQPSITPSRCDSNIG